MVCKGNIKHHAPPPPTYTYIHTFVNSLACVFLYFFQATHRCFCCWCWCSLLVFTITVWDFAANTVILLLLTCSSYLPVILQSVDLGQSLSEGSRIVHSVGAPQNSALTDHLLHLGLLLYCFTQDGFRGFIRFPVPMPYLLTCFLKWQNFRIPLNWYTPTFSWLSSPVAADPEHTICHLSHHPSHQHPGSSLVTAYLSCF